MQLFVDIRPGAGTKAVGSAYGRLATEQGGQRHDYVFEADATVVVDPVQGKRCEPWWMIAQSCDDLAAYYRSIVARRFGIRLLKPSFGAHVTVMAEERPLRDEAGWKRFHGLRVRFSYTHDVYTNGSFWWLRVSCPELDRIREHFGVAPAGSLGPDGTVLHKVPLHLTVGRAYPGDIRPSAGTPWG